MIQETVAPQHVVIIPDGNRRWAKARGLNVLEGHQYVASQIFPRLIAHAIDRGISYLTFWIFSRENWKRSQEEVEGLMSLFHNLGMKKLIEDANKVKAKVKILGNLDDFDLKLQKAFADAVRKTESNQAITVNLALSYSGRDEIVRALKKILENNPHLNPSEITENMISSNLDTAGIPDPDLIIRTSGEQRLSGLFSWQSAYSELYFTDTKMPDFTEKEFDLALEDYFLRQRRFGK